MENATGPSSESWLVLLNRTTSLPPSPPPPTDYLPTWLDLLLALAFSTLIIVTIVGNTLVIAAVITTRRLRSVTNCFVSSLAAADLLVGLAVMPPAVLLQLNGGTWELGELLCDSWVSLDVLLCTASILSLCAISIDRYLAVTQPLIYSRRRRSKRLAGGMIVVVWIMAGAITSPPLLGCFPRPRQPGPEGSTGATGPEKKCSYNMDSSYVVFSAVGSFFLPMLVMLYVYGRISCVIAKRHHSLETSDALGPTAQPPSAAAPATGWPRMHRRSTRRATTRASGHNTASHTTSHSATTTTTTTTTTQGAGGSRAKQHQQRQEGGGGESESEVVVRKPSQGQQSHGHSCINRVSRETKTAGTLAVVVGGFVACWLPFFVLYLATPFMPVEPPAPLMPALTWLGWINSAINPFIYAFYSADFRMAFWRLTFRKCMGSRFDSHMGQHQTGVGGPGGAGGQRHNWTRQTSRT